MSERAFHSHGAMDVDMLASKIDEYMQALLNHPDVRVKESARQMLDGLDALHREALGRMITGLSKEPQLRDEIAGDPIVRLVLELYGLVHEDDGKAVAERALESVRGYIESHGGQLEVTDVQGGVVRLHLSGSCHGCAGSTITLKRGVEQALRNGFPGFEEMVVEEAVPKSEPLPQPSSRHKPIFNDVVDADDVSAGQMRAAMIDGIPVLVINIDGDLYAYRNGCGDSPLPLDLGQVEGSLIRCPWHNDAFDARTGLAIPPAKGQLQAFPVAVQRGIVRVAVNAPGYATVVS